MSPKKSLDSGSLKKSELKYKQTSITVFCDLDIKSEVTEFLEDRYDELEAYCSRNPIFLVSYDPIKVEENAPDIVRRMADAGGKAGVGPMAAVAGTFSELVGRFLLENGAEEVIVENGGDIFLKLEEERTVGLYAGNSIFSNRIGFKIIPEQTPLAICTSSSSVGHSVSLGDSDAVSVFAESGALADAAATSIGNRVKGVDGINLGLRGAEKIKGITGVVIIRGDEMGFLGKLPEIVHL